MSFKKDYVVLLLQNLQQNKRHMNGTRYIVKFMTDNVSFLGIVSGSHKKTRLALPRIPFDPGGGDFPASGFRRIQFPNRICFALPMNASQDQSFSGALGLDVCHACFTPGQTYFALSRTAHPDNLYLWTERSDRMKTNVVCTSPLITWVIKNKISCPKSERFSQIFLNK